MASESDPFNASERGEQAPLLGNSHRPVDEDERPLSPKPQHEKATRSGYVWRVVWAILAIFVLAVFIKGWIDAEETDVRCSPESASLPASSANYWC